MYEKVGYRCLEISARENRNIDQVRELVKDKTTLFTGHSGVGKSALINAIDPELKLRVGDVSEWSMKGKHTTTFANNNALVGIPFAVNYRTNSYNRVAISVFSLEKSL